MNNIRNIKDKYNFKVKKYIDNGNTKIIDTDKGKFLIKVNKKEKEELYNYLLAKKFENYIKPYNNLDDDYEIYPYLDNLVKDNDDKGIDIIYLISLLHNKTTFYKSFNSDEKKKIYEEKIDELNKLSSYYDALRYIIEEDMYPSPSKYLLLNNITVIYNSLDNSSYFIKKWYDKVSSKENKRVALIHGNLDISHIIENNNSYLISWDKSRVDMPIIDIYNFFENDYKYLDLNSLFDIYLSKYPLYEEEKYLFFSYLLTPKRLDFNNLEILNTREVSNHLDYLNKANILVSKHYSKESKHKTGYKE